MTHTETRRHPGETREEDGFTGQAKKNKNGYIINPKRRLSVALPAL
jgi:hypothetical protein